MCLYDNYNSNIETLFTCVKSTYSTVNIFLVLMQENRLSCWNHYLLGRSSKVLGVKTLFSCVNTIYSTVNKILVSMQELRLSFWNHDLLGSNLEILGRRKYLFSCENYNSYVETLFACVKSTYSAVNKIVLSMQELHFSCWNYDLLGKKPKDFW